MNDSTIFVIIVSLLALILIVVIPTLMVILVFRKDRGYEQGSRHVNTDLVSMQILFQTMRDFLSEQKGAARDFNETMDKKMKQVRRLMEEVRQEPEKMRQAQATLAATLTEVRRDLARVQQEVARVRGDAGVESTLPDAISYVEPATVDSLAIPSPPSTDELKERLMPLLEEEDEAPVTSELIDSWTGLEVTGADSEFDVDDDFFDEPESPEDAQAARDAFRSLLNINDAPESATMAEGNGGGSSSLQQRVFEYSDAGMRTPDIAKELGVSKGDVKMILSTREENAG